MDPASAPSLTPKRFEGEQDLTGAAPAARPLLVVTGQSTPSRRFLAELVRTSPAQARRLVVATGDAVSFNTIYRDRRVTWPIQDLPFPFVFFCHYDPIDAGRRLSVPPEGAPRATEVENGLDLPPPGRKTPA